MDLGNENFPLLKKITISNNGWAGVGVCGCADLRRSLFVACLGEQRVSTCEPISEPLRRSVPPKVREIRLDELVLGGHPPPCKPSPVEARVRRRRRLDRSEAQVHHAI